MNRFQNADISEDLLCVTYIPTDFNISDLSLDGSDPKKSTDQYIFEYVCIRARV